jgi:hypothetical protein
MKQQNTLIRFEEFNRGGAPIDAGRDPTPTTNSDAISVHYLYLAEGPGSVLIHSQ